MKHPPFTDPSQIKELQDNRLLYRLGLLSEDDFLRLYLDAQELSYPVFGWFYMSRKIFKNWLQSV